MPKIAKELTAAQVKSIKAFEKARGYPVGGVPGLLLWVKPSDAKSWILRTTISGRRVDLGLGSYPMISLAEARNAARSILTRYKLENVNPLLEKKLRREKEKELQSRPTFTYAAESFLARKSDEWRNPKHAQQWKQTLATYVVPKIGKKAVAEITRSDIQSVLDPIWDTKRETATRIRGRMESVLAYAAVMGWRDETNPAQWKGALDKIYSTKKTVLHHPALPWQRVGEFMKTVRESEANSARALEFTILTASRVGMVLGATWSEIDIEKKCWTVPKTRMKSGVEFRVALSDDALALLLKMKSYKRNELVFPAQRGGKISDMTLTKFIRDSHERRIKAGLPGWFDPKSDNRVIVVHGFRSTFRDFCADTGNPAHLAEQALAHVIGDKVISAYNRSDLFEQRIEMMNRWAAQCRV